MVVESARRRFEQGHPPTEDAEKEWFKIQREKMNKKSSQQEQELSETNPLSSIVPRPNAYIPEDDSALPIPKPYGANAPFKPSEQGTNMRHIRKPQAKPLEL
eukprot:Sdes_comp15986_c0_seq3m5155